MRMKKVIFLILFLTPSLLFGSIIVASEKTIQNNKYTENLMNLDQSKNRILFDESHTANGSSMWIPSNVSIFNSILETHGYASDTNFDYPIESQILEAYDVLVLFFPMVPLDASEITAIHDFVESGGGLLLVGVDHMTGGWHFTPNNLNPISTEYGITFTEDRWMSICTTFSSHPVTQDVDSIHPNGEQMMGCVLSVQAPASCIAEVAGHSVVAIAEVGSGRVACVGAAAPFLQYNRLRQWQSRASDLHQFSLNIIDWLAFAPQRQVIDPEKHVLRVGEGPILLETEVEDYEMYVGLMHDHTNYSDGQHSPEQMVMAGLSRGLDFMILSDHSYGSPSAHNLGGIGGALAAKRFVEYYGLDCCQFIGAELSGAKHSFAFPLHQNIFTNDQQEMVDQAHEQDAIIGLCHPMISPTYAEIYSAYDELGYDAIEVDNRGFFYGCGEEGFFKNFYGASDGHSTQFVGKILNAVFIPKQGGVENQPNASLFADAIINRRVVILDRINNLIYGQGIWVDRYLEILENAESAVANAENQIQQLIAADLNVNLSRHYLHDADVALEWGNPTRAIRAAEDAISEEIQSIALECVLFEDHVSFPEDNITFSLSVYNGLEYNIQINTTLVQSIAVELAPTCMSSDFAVDSKITLTREGRTAEFGHAEIVLNLQILGPDRQLAPVILKMGGFIDSEPDIFVMPLEEGVNVSIGYQTNVEAWYSITYAKLIYYLGVNQYNAEMIVGFGRIHVTIGPFYSSQTLEFYMELENNLGETIVLSIRTYHLSMESPQELEGMYLFIGLGFIGVVTYMMMFGIIRHHNKLENH